MRQNVSSHAMQAMGMTPEDFAADARAMEAHKIVESYATRVSVPMGTQQAGLLVAVVYDILGRMPEEIKPEPKTPARSTRGSKK